MPLQLTQYPTNVLGESGTSNEQFSSQVNSTTKSGSAANQNHRIHLYKLTTDSYLKSALENARGNNTAVAIADLKWFMKNPPVVKASRTYQNACFALAALYFKEGNPFEGRKMVDIAYSVFQPDDLYHLNLFSQFSNTECRLDIEATLQEAIDHFSKDRKSSLEKTGFFSTERALRNASKEDNAVAKLVRAAKFFRAGKLRIAEKYLKQAYEINPDLRQFDADARDNAISNNEFRNRVQQSFAVNPPQVVFR